MRTFGPSRYTISITYNIAFMELSRRTEDLPVEIIVKHTEFLKIKGPCVEKIEFNVLILFYLIPRKMNILAGKASKKTQC